MKLIIVDIVAVLLLCSGVALLINTYRNKYKFSSETKIWLNSASAGFIALGFALFFVFYFVSKTLEAFSLFLRLFTVIMGSVAFIIAFLNFQRKSFALNKDGVGNLIYTAHFHKYNWNHQFYITNLKDRSVVVYEVVLKFKNISVVLPFDYPINLGGYGATGITMNYLDCFISRRTHEGVFEVKSNDNQFHRYHSEIYDKEFSGDKILQELSSGKFDVYAVTNIRKEQILLLEQEIGTISKNGIHIDEVRFSDTSDVQENMMDHPDIDLKHLNLIDQGETFTVQKSDRYY